MKGGAAVHVLIEYSRLADGWRGMNVEQRQRYMQEVGRQLEPFFARGLRVLAAGFRHPDTSHPADYDFFAVYAAPDRALIAELERAIDQAGWYELVEQINIGGESLPLESYMQRLIAAERTDAPIPA